MLRSLAGWICDLGAAFLALTATISRDRAQRRYRQQCWLNAMAAER